MGSTAYDPAGSTYDCDVALPILQDYVKSEDASSLENTIVAIAEMLPKNRSLSHEIYNLGEDCIEVAEESSWRGSAHLRLIQLLKALEDEYFLNDEEASQPSRYQRLGESMRENLPEPDGENPDAFVNYHAFAAHLEAEGIWPHHPTWAIWAMREALEEDTSNENKLVRSARLLGAGQWILWNGRSLFKSMTETTTEAISAHDRKSWRGGSLYSGKEVLSIERWRFWKSRFEELTQGSGVTDECKGVVAKVIMLMDMFQ